MHHPNRFVRETAHFTAATLCQALQGEGEGRLLAVGQDLAERLADGLSDNWSQVRRPVCDHPISIWAAYYTDQQSWGPACLFVVGRGFLSVG
jgi:hypothetical protein